MVLLYEDLSYKLRGIFFEVYNQLGPGFKEEVYAKSILELLENNGIPYEKEKQFAVYFGEKRVGTTKLDVVVDNRIIVEIKAVDILHSTFKKQLISYLKATGLKLAFLVNFGNSRLEIKRFVNECGKNPRNQLRKPLV